MNRAPRVAIVVLNYRNHADTVECVQTLARMDYPEFEIVVVDNDSQNGSEEILRRTFPTHTVLQSGSNLGYAGGNNVGLRHALLRDAAFALILNNDTLVQPDFLERMVSHAEEHPDAGLFGAQIVHTDGRPDRMSARRVPPLLEIFWNRGPGKWFGLHRGLEAQAYDRSFIESSAAHRVEIVSGSCMLLRRELLEEIGLLDEATFLFWEEFILAEKLRASRYHTILLADVHVTHKGGQAVKSIDTRAARAYLQSLNYYLKQYRDAGLLRRYATLLGPALYFLPGTLKTASRIRRST